MASLSWEKLVLLGLVVFVKEEGVVALDGILGGVWGRASGVVEWRSVVFAAKYICKTKKWPHSPDLSRVINWIYRLVDW